jgi:hypothetical protein
MKLVIWFVSLLAFGLLSHFTGKRAVVEGELTSVSRIDSDHRVNDPLTSVPRIDSDLRVNGPLNPCRESILTIELTIP